VVLRAGLLVGGPGMFRGLMRMVRGSFVVVVPGFGRARLEPLHVDDLARYCVEAADRPDLAGRFDLSCGEMLSGELMARSIAEHLGLRRWILGAPAAAAGPLSGAMTSEGFPAAAVLHWMAALRGGLLPTTSDAGTDFSFQPLDLRQCMASATGIDYPLHSRRKSRFGAWKAPERRGILGKKPPLRRR
ncbi:MAG: hypothetical protein HKN12_01280, partial [Gemmatimonadetes bacterium]|nr:hypothetical protein [Gemmatimonadota bacterium]